MTNFEITSFIYGRLREKNLHEKISGGIYRDVRPVNSRKQDITIRCDTVPQDVSYLTAQAQVIIHTPDMKVSSFGTGFHNPDHLALEGLSKAVSDALDGYYKYPFIVWVSGQNLEKEEEAHLVRINLEIIIRNTVNQ